MTDDKVRELIDMAVSAVTDGGRITAWEVKRGEPAARISDAKSDSHLMIKWALAQGQQAAEHGRVFPLSLWLDLAPGLMFPELGSAPIRKSQASNPYVNWLRDFYAFQYRFGVRTPTGPGRSSGAVPGCWPLIMDLWPPAQDSNLDGESSEWADAYRTLCQNDQQVQEIWQRWQEGSGSVNSIPWCDKYRDMIASGQSRPQALLWNTYLAASSDKPIHETFDHAAADLYLEVEDPPLLPHQERHIAELRRRRQTLSQLPPASFEEPVPYNGVIPISILLDEDVAYYKIVNNGGPRIGELSPVLPDQRISVHLCWAHAASSVNGKYDEYHSAASILQGVVALLLDDWQVALRDLPIDFLAHRGEPTNDDGVANSGVRWKESLRTGQAAPDPETARKFFRRRRCTEMLHAGSHELRWNDRANEYGLERHAWWCVCLLESDMPAFGFERHNPSGPAGSRSAPGWSADKGILADCVSHVILLASGPNTGSDNIYHVRRDMQRIELWSIPQPYPAPPDNANALAKRFTPLRSFAMDVLLQVLPTIYG